MELVKRFRFIILIGLIFIISPIISKGQNDIIGVVKTNKGHTVSAAYISLSSMKSKQEYTTITDSLGRFRLYNLKYEKYLLKIISLSTIDTSFYIDEDRLNKEILMVVVEKENVLNVTVTKKREQLIQIKPDKIVFDPTLLPSSEGSSAFDLMRRTPFITANENGKILFRGTLGVSVMLNGRLLQMSSEQVMNYLKSISAIDVEKIEIIANPSSKYDAQGIGGIINIILKKNKTLGLYGSASIYTTQTTYNKQGGSLDINWRTKRFNIFGGVSNRNGKYLTIDKVDNLFESNNYLYNYDENDTKHRYKHYTLLRSGVDFTLDKKSVLGARLEYSSNDNTGYDYNSSLFLKNKLQLDSEYNTKNLYVNRNHTFTGNLNYERKIDSFGQVITFNLDYLKYRQPELSTMSNTERFDKSYIKLGNDVIFKNSSFRDIDIRSLKMDYTKSIKKFVNLELGAKAYSLKTLSVINYDNYQSGLINNDLEKSGRFNYREDNMAGYFSVNREFNKFWTAQAGVRYERTSLKGTNQFNQKIFSIDYGRIFPSVYIQYAANEDNQFVFSYNRRIIRPDFESLTPFKFYATPLSYVQGNPLLFPTFSNNLELSYTVKQRIVLSMFSYLIQNEISEFPILDSTNYSYSYQTLNFDRNINAGISAYIPIKVTKWWSMSATPIVGINRVRSLIKNLNYTNKNILAQIQLINQLNISKKSMISSDVSLLYQPKGLNSGLFMRGETLDLGIAIRKNFKDQRSSLSIYFSDLLNKAYVSSEIRNNYQSSLTSGSYDERGVRVTFSYRFGKKTVKKSRSLESAISSEKARVD